MDHSGAATSMRTTLFTRTRHMAAPVCEIYYLPNNALAALDTEADLGMFNMFGRTRAPQKGGPTKAQKKFHFLQHGNKPEILK